MIYDFIWRVRTRFPERKGQRCTVLIRSRRMNSALVEFEDGFQVVTSRNYVRKAKMTISCITGEQMIAEFERIKKLIGPPPEAMTYYVNPVMYDDLKSRTVESKGLVFGYGPASLLAMRIVPDTEISIFDRAFYYRVIRDDKSELVLSKVLNP